MGPVCEPTDRQPRIVTDGTRPRNHRRPEDRHGWIASASLSSRAEPIRERWHVWKAGRACLFKRRSVVWFCLLMLYLEVGPQIPRWLFLVATLSAHRLVSDQLTTTLNSLYFMDGRAVARVRTWTYALPPPSTYHTQVANILQRTLVHSNR